MTKIIVDNTSAEARQRQLEAQVQVAFANASSAVLTFLAGKSERNIVKAMQEFIDIHEAAKRDSIDPKGIAIRVPKLDAQSNSENEHINMILRGSLSMVAAMLKRHAKVPINTPAGDEAWTKVDKQDYDKALQEIGNGIELQMAAHSLGAVEPT
ncbi:hypothetical protein [Bradyrhizobium sp. RT3a]|uniref:hypothetical protein n=1 Tax=unclassified Bradyrhizobium TaxID=2631580 RepID=UPI003395B424